jgi:hypothetical protein
MGFVSYKSATDHGKNATIYYKDTLITESYTEMFDLTAADTASIQKKTTNYETVLQTLAYDNNNQAVYIAQIIPDGVQLSGESAPVTYADRRLHGDLVITKWSLTGTVLGKMYVKGFGRGEAMGVEPSGADSYLWLESDAVSDDGVDGYGTKIARFKFVDNTVLLNSSTSSTFTKYTPMTGVDRVSVNVDMVYGILTMRYRSGGTFHYKAYNLATFKTGTFTQVATVNEPTMGTFQGFATFGSFLYLLEGTQYSTSNPSPTGNTRLRSVNLYTGNEINNQLTTAGSSLLYRYPGGLSIQQPDISDYNTFRLSFGLASYTSSTNTDKQQSIYYKSSLITGTSN